MRILLIEDYAILLSAVEERLKREGYAVDSTGDGDEGLWLAKENPYALVILDLTLPNIDGLDILKAVRQRGQDVSVIITTARDGVDDRIRGLDSGADDYLVKPFSLDELMARIRVQLRHSGGKRNPILKIADLEVNETARTATRGGDPLELTAKEFALLELLALRSGQVVSRSDIWEQLYDFAEETDSNVIDVFVTRLRKKLETGGRPRILHTRRGLGYMLGSQVGATR
jgi:DNA-binding response OmpR family regulator